MSTQKNNSLLSGFLAVVKPAGPSSAAVVGRVKRMTGVHRVGHSGTLDPAADGVLVLAINRATRLFPYLISDKSYRAVVRLGEETSTYDAAGEQVATKPVPSLHIGELDQLLQSFQGESEQIPPMVSALHHQGKRLYELARQGKTVTRAARLVTLYSIRLLSYAAPDLMFDVACSRGTYIRSLAHDIGDRLGCGAHLHRLTRTSCNGFSLEAAVGLDELETAVREQRWEMLLHAPQQGLAHLRRLDVADSEVAAVRNGNTVLLTHTAKVGEGEIVRLHDASGRILALAEKRAEQLRMVYVLRPANEVMI